jgi:predicted acetyltransferase
LSPLSISFRYARLEEVQEVARLTSHSFPGKGRDPEWWMERFRETSYGDGPEIIWVGEEAGRLVASCQLHRLSHWVSGVEVPSMGLGTVAIAPTHRRRGIAGRMVETGLRAARERGDLASSLYPFRASFYGRFGYGLSGDAHQYHIPPAVLPPGEANDQVEVVAGEAALAEIRGFYESWAPSQTGQVKRTERVWRELTSGPDRLLVGYRGGDGLFSGYALATYVLHPPPAERYLSVDELAWATTDARRGLYGWLSSLGDQWSGLVMRALPEHRLEDWLIEPRLVSGTVPLWGIWFPSAALLRGPMFRLLDLKRAWTARRVEPDAALTVALDVQDEQLLENGGRWRLRFENGAVEVVAGEGSADVHLRLGIQALSRIYTGALPPTAAAAGGLAEVDRPAGLDALDRALRLPQPWTFDKY